MVEQTLLKVCWHIVPKAVIDKVLQLSFVSCSFSVARSKELKVPILPFASIGQVSESVEGIIY